MHSSLESFLESADGAAKVMAHARLLLKLSRRFENLAPAGLIHAARVANYKSGKVIIHADNGAVAAKIRQLGQRICDELSKAGAQCSGIEVKVQPRQIPYQSRASAQKPLTARTCAVLAGAAGDLPADAPLRQALEQLLKRSAKQE